MRNKANVIQSKSFVECRGNLTYLNEMSPYLP